MGVSPREILLAKSRVELLKELYNGGKIHGGTSSTIIGVTPGVIMGVSPGEIVDATSGEISGETLDFLFKKIILESALGGILAGNLGAIPCVANGGTHREIPFMWNSWRHPEWSS